MVQYYNTGDKDSTNLIAYIFCSFVRLLYIHQSE